VFDYPERREWRRSGVRDQRNLRVVEELSESPSDVSCVAVLMDFSGETKATAPVPPSILATLWRKPMVLSPTTLLWLT